MMNHRIVPVLLNLGIVFLVLMLFKVTRAHEMNSEPLSTREPSGITEEFKDGFSFLFKAVGQGLLVETNPTLLDDYRGYYLAGELRPDFYLDFRRLHLVAKPRARLTWEKIELENDSETNTDTEGFVNEWLASLRLPYDVYASYGRENLQWGPSELLSPSNPFFKLNGRTRPLFEIPGMDYARLLSIINPTWTMSFIANTAKGRQDFPFGFEKTYAFKLDFTGDQKYFSLIPSKKEGDRGRLGGFAGWTVTDALTLHTEWELFSKLNPDYQLFQLTKRLLSAADIPADIAEPDQYSDHEIDGLVLVGGSYTLVLGPTFILEYLYNGAGFDDEHADQIYDALRKLSNGANQNQTSATPISTLDNFDIPYSVLLRKNYLFGQYQHLQIWNRFNFALRYLYNLDDDSSRLNTILSLDAGEYLRLFAIGNKSFGTDFSEFPLLFDYSVSVGFEFSF